MKYLIAELLDKLAEKEEASKELVAQIEALEIVVTAMLRKMELDQQKSIAAGIESAMFSAGVDASDENAVLLRNYVDKLLKHPRI
ncbi:MULTISPECIES: anti-adapter protein IraP [Pantoea]|jgi:rubrerythrin|uniref:anti-adapter protein IraP n=1 Tax=Pantoea TaxID=53335 RepID=UPI001C063B16|nr:MULTISPECIES: anti-adapter protein IraP [Pantoea]